MCFVCAVWEGRDPLTLRLCHATQRVLLRRKIQVNKPRKLDITLGTRERERVLSTECISKLLRSSSYNLRWNGKKKEEVCAKNAFAQFNLCDIIIYWITHSRVETWESPHSLNFFIRCYQVSAALDYNTARVRKVINHECSNSIDQTKNTIEVSLALLRPRVSDIILRCYQSV